MVHKPKSSHRGLHALQRKHVNTNGRIAALYLVHRSKQVTEIVLTTAYDRKVLNVINERYKEEKKKARHKSSFQSWFSGRFLAAYTRDASYPQF
jgi:tRNA G37 N-methylase Trm5